MRARPTSQILNGRVSSLLFPFLSVAAALALALGLGRFAPGIADPLLLAAVALSAWLGGLWCGLLATVLAALSSGFLHPLLDPTAAAHVTRLLVFAMVSVLLSAVISRAGRRLREEETVSVGSSGRLELITDTVPVLISYIDRAQRYRLVNRAYVEWFGRSRTEIEGRHVREVLGDAVYHKVRPHLEAALTGEQVRFETALERPGGDSRYVSATYVPHRGTGGKVEGLVALVSDITERRREESSLRVSEARCQRLLDSNLVGIVFADAGGEVTQVNDAFLELVGCSREDLLSGKVCWADLSPPEYRDLEARTVRDWKEKEPKKRVLLEREYLRRDGTRVPVLEGVARLEGSPGEYVCFVLDISARKQAEQARADLLSRERAARAEADAANMAKDEFLAMLSHEIRTPLQSILGWTSLLRSSKMAPDQAERALEIIESNAHAQAKLIDDLLDHSRIMNGKLHLDLKALDLPSVVRTAVDALRPAAEEKGLGLTLELDPWGGMVWGDAERLQQVVWNILQNAIKFTPAGGRIEVSVELSRGQARIAVSDTGAGISAELLPQIFDRFRQGSPGGKRKGGLGLGLAIVRHIVELHGGSVTVESPGVGQGSTFTLVLPLRAARRHGAAPAAAGGRPEGATEPPPEAVEHSLEGLKVLVVDDEADARELLTAVFQRSGAEVAAVESAAEALKALSSEEGRLPDVLVCDIAMPEESGYDLIHKVRLMKPERGGRIPAVALTAYASTVDRMRALAAGYQTHIAKPIEPVELTAVVAGVAREGVKGRTGR